MANKFGRNHHATGYWSGSPWKRVEYDQTAAKIRVWQQDQIRTRGMPVYLYMPVTTNTPGVTVCTCVKEGNSVADRPCHSCYGTGLVPGYTLFMHQTIWASSAYAGSYTLASTALDTTKKPHRIVLTGVSLSGTIITTDSAYTNPDSLDWETNVDAYVRDAGNTVTTEFSTNAGATWTNIASINGPNKPIGTGNIRFRITLARTTTTQKSPAFEALRIRRVLAENANRCILDSHGRYAAGQILILRTWMQERAQRMDGGRGVVNELLADRSWTNPLDFFDTTLTPDTPAARIDDRDAGPHPFYEHAFGIREGERLVMTQFSWSEQLGCFTHQAFNERRATDGEIYSLVF